MALLRPHHRVPGGPAQAATPSQRAKTSLSAVFRFKGGCEGGEGKKAEGRMQNAKGVARLRGLRLG